MERGIERARLLAEQLPHTVVLHEEGVSKDSLLAQGVDHAGAFVACAGDDRANLLAALHAKQLGADLALAVVSREEFVPLVDALGIDAAFSPRLVTAEGILRFVRGENVRAMHLLLSGSEVVELCPEAGAPVDGRAIDAAGLPPGCEMAAVVRGGEVLFPGPGDRLSAGDRVLLFGVDRATAKIQRAFNA